MPFTATVTGVPTGPLSGESVTDVSIEKPAWIEPALALLQHDIVKKAEILRRWRRHRDP
jgi:hypothetical protein